MNVSSEIATNTSNFQKLCSKKYNDIWLYVGLIILCSGTIGHLLSITVTLSSRSMRLHSSTVYISSLSLAALLALYTGLLRYVTIYTDLHAIDFRRGSEVSCKLHTMLTYMSLQFFAWIQATIAVDRLIAVWSPHRYKVCNSWKKGLLVVLVELVLVTSLNVIVIVLAELDENSYCSALNQKLANAWYVVDMLSFSLLPATVIILCNSLILFKLHRHKQSQSSSTHRKIHSLNMTLMVVNLVFLVTTLPISLHFIFIRVDIISNADLEYCLLYTMFGLTQYFGISCTFLVYCITNGNFRLKLQSLFQKYICCSCCQTIKSSKVNPSIYTSENTIAL